jgi:predicted MFS family arabinose efflux permease
VAATSSIYSALLVGRALQGLGGSSLLTIGLAVVTGSFSGAARARALGFYLSAGASAAVVGPLAGGVISSVGGWPGIFWSQIPLAAAVALGSAFLLPSRASGAATSLDLPGIGLASLALLAVNVALLQADSWGWTSTAVVGLALLAVLALLAFVARERRAAEPAVRLSVFRSRIFVASSLVGAAAWFGILSGSVQLSVYLQAIRGLDPTRAAFVLLLWPLSVAILFPRAAAIVARIGPERVLILSPAGGLLGGLAMVAFDSATPYPVIAVVAALAGIPIALGVTAGAMLALAEFPPAEAGVASGVFNSLRQVGSTLGVAVPAALFDLSLDLGGGDPVRGSSWALASRAVAFGIVLVPVFLLLRDRLAAPRREGKVALADPGVEAG